jgi:hypothetical protein
MGREGRRMRGINKGEGRLRRERGWVGREERRRGGEEGEEGRHLEHFEHGGVEERRDGPVQAKHREGAVPHLGSEIE